MNLNPRDVAIKALEKELAKIESQITLRTKIEKEALDVEGKLWPLVNKVSTLELEIKCNPKSNTKAFAEKKKSLSLHKRRLKQYRDSLTQKWMHEGDDLLKAQFQFKQATSSIKRTGEVCWV